ncbi:unnamed protein product [Paramecium pentaurelia]|uniref:Uncharacterized protein n=1 Tax=Paramecium pentaurelia TaxID=43138 RepID=A0A8S1SRK6_9CILI|nr:unnamed protein product [Paramecium pentaurelia]
MENPSIALVMSSETRMKEICKLRNLILQKRYLKNGLMLFYQQFGQEISKQMRIFHCAAGISRSFDIVRTLFDFSNIYINQYREIQSIQIFIDNSLQDKMHKIKPQKVLRRIKQTRPYENPNKGFTKQLEKSNQEVMEQKQ